MVEEKKILIKDLKKDDIVNDIFVVKFKKPVEQYRNGYKFELRLGDSSKEIMYKYWGSQNETYVQGLYDSINKDDVVYVQGRVNEWNEALEISANDNNDIHVLQKHEYNPRDFIKKTKKSISEMMNQLNEIINSVKNPELKSVLDYFFKNNEFVEKFKEWPSAMYIHHGWIGGLLEHTLAVAKLCVEFQKIHFKLDRDLLLTGAILHDIGKLKEFEISTSITMSKEGMLVGHVNLGLDMLKQALNHLNTENEVKLKLIHMMMTHMGEYGSNKLPSFPEALAINLIDQLDGNLNHMENLKEDANTEDDHIYTKHFGNVYLK